MFESATQQADRIAERNLSSLIMGSHFFNGLQALLFDSFQMAGS